MNEEIGFKNLEDLYKRVLPALRSKRSEIDRLGHDYIKEVDIWNFLVGTSWKDRKKINLSDLVSDILNTENDLIIEYVIGIIKKDKREANFEEKDENEIL